MGFKGKEKGNSEVANSTVINKGCCEESAYLSAHHKKATVWTNDVYVIW